MALTENPKKIAEDIASGLRSFHKAMLRSLEAGDIKVLVEHLNGLQITIRQELIPLDDPEYNDKIKTKNMRMGRIRNAITLMKTYAHQRGIKGVF